MHTYITVNSSYNIIERSFEIRLDDLSDEQWIQLNHTNCQAPVLVILHTVHYGQLLFENKETSFNKKCIQFSFLGEVLINEHNSNSQPRNKNKILKVWKSGSNASYLFPGWSFWVRIKECGVLVEYGWWIVLAVLILWLWIFQGRRNTRRKALAYKHSNDESILFDAEINAQINNYPSVKCIDYPLTPWQIGYNIFGNTFKWMKNILARFTIIISKCSYYKGWDNQAVIGSFLNSNEEVFLNLLREETETAAQQQDKHQYGPLVSTTGRNLLHTAPRSPGSTCTWASGHKATEPGWPSLHTLVP